MIETNMSGCTGIPIKFLGQRLAEPTSDKHSTPPYTVDPEGQCQRMLSVLTESKSKKQYRNGWDKHLSMDILPDLDELRIFAPKRSDSDSDRIHKLSSIVGVDFQDKNFAINVKGESGTNMCYAFAIKRKGDYFALASKILVSSQACRAPSPPTGDTTASDAESDTVSTTTDNGIEAKTQINTLQSENASLKASLEIETKKRLISERKMEKSKRELAEIQAHMALLSAEVATELAQIKSEELEQESELILSGITSMKNSISVLGLKMDSLLKSNADGDDAETNAYLEVVAASSSKLQTLRTSQRKTSNDRFIQLMKRMSSLENSKFSRNPSAESADTGIYSHDGNFSVSSNQSQDLHNFSNNNNNNDADDDAPITTTTTPTNKSAHSESAFDTKTKTKTGTATKTATTTATTTATAVLVVAPIALSPHGVDVGNVEQDAAVVKTTPSITILDDSISKVCAQFRTLTGTDEAESMPPGHTARLENDAKHGREDEDTDFVTSPNEPLPMFSLPQQTPQTLLQHTQTSQPQTQQQRQQPQTQQQQPQPQPHQHDDEYIDISTSTSTAIDTAIQTHPHPHHPQQSQLHPPQFNLQVHSPQSGSSRPDVANQSFHLHSVSTISEMRDFTTDWIKMTDRTTEVVETIHIAKSSEGAGFAIAGGVDEEVQEGDAAIYVSNIVVDGAAQKDNRLQRGDKILSVNGSTLESVTHDRAKQIISDQQDLELTVSRLPVEDTFEVEYFSVSGAAIFELTPNSHDCVVHELFPQAHAWVGAHLRPNDKILKINGVETKDKSMSEWLQLLTPQRNASTCLNIARIHDPYNTSIFNSTLSQHTTIVEDHLEIAFNTSASGLGFSIAGGSDHPVQAGDASIYVTHIIEGCAAALDGRLCVGDRLLEVNGTSTLSVTHAAAVKALTLNPAGVHMHVSRLPVHEEELIDVEFDIGDGGLGFSIFGGYDQHGDEDPGILVLRIAEGGSAARSGALQPGDKIVGVNGVELGRIMHDEAVALLGAISGRISMRISRLTEIKKEEEIYVDIELTENPNEEGGLGFSVAGGRDHPIDDGDPAIYVTHINEGGVVHRDGQLRFGDKVVRVNGTDLIDVTHDEAINTLKTIAGKLQLRVARYASPNEESEDILRIEFKVGQNQKLGLRISGGIDADINDGDSAVYVSEITDGAAATDGRLKEGDKILVCNGETFVNVTHAQALQALRSNPAEIKLTIARLSDPEL